MNAKIELTCECCGSLEPQRSAMHAYEGYLICANCYDFRREELSARRIREDEESSGSR